jgi:hypothetical protein
MSMLRRPGCGAACACTPSALGTGAHGSQETRIRRTPRRAASAWNFSSVRPRENASKVASACGEAPTPRAQSSACQGST